MKNLLQTIATHQTKSEKIEKIAAELDKAIQTGSAQHFVQWHNSKVTPDKHISPNWFEQYRKEAGL